MSVSPTTAITCPTRDVRASPPSAMIYIGTKPSPESVCLVVARFKSRPDGPPMDAVLCLYCVVQKGERRGEYPGAPPHHLRKKEGRRRKKQLADRKPSSSGVTGARSRGGIEFAANVGGGGGEL
ncbi:hypothetical protein GEV33_011241 [Tenebrio molitor]|uniref:Uncharacterized protein n=1 Tax=Tenebrio molitor TaxID=7067 RepID=A0A8J6LG11_TENMO|nr:hypothetical protein GEV33_011241 [Tenebrio molitor]